MKVSGSRSGAGRAGFLVLVVALIAGAVASSAWAKGGPPPQPPEYDPTTIVVRFKSEAAATAGIAAQGDSTAGALGSGTRVVRIRGGSIDSSIAAYSARPDVLYAERNYVVRASDLGPPNDTAFGMQWGLGAIRAIQAWSLYPGAYSGTDATKIAVVDTGIDAPHPDLAGQVLTAQGANCLSGACVASPAQDDEGHGTHVAGIAAASTNNAVGIAGVGFASDLVPVKVLGSTGDGTDASVAAGIAWATARGARVINLSLGRDGPFATVMCDAVAAANAAGSLVVAAAGNDGVTTPHYPAACPGAIGIAATDITGASPDFSNWGSPNVFLSAPGAGIYSTYWNGGSTYDTLTGTSMASPHVAGVAALLFGQRPMRSPLEVKRLLAQTSQKVGATLYPGLSYGADPYGTCSGCTWHPFYGYGLVDAGEALAIAVRANIDSFAPSSGAVGSNVVLTGSNFVDVSQVSLGMVPTTFTVDSPTQITAQVPAGLAPDGYRWRVTTPVGTSVNDSLFTIVPPPVPTISGFAPLSGPVGLSVVLTGTNFVGVDLVSLGNVATTFTVDSPTQITAQVPSGLTPDGYRWRVRTPNGTAVNDALFAITVPSTTPTLDSFAPGSGPVGSSVVLTGTNLGQVTQVTLGNVNAAFVLDSPTRLTAQVPAGAAAFPTVRWRVHWAGGGVALHDTPFVVTGGGPAPATIASFAPLSGPVGSNVVLTGTNFVGVDLVSLGNVATTFTVDSPTQITAQVPAGLTPDGYRWRVRTPAGTAVNDALFTITVPSTLPTFTSFSPGSGLVGATVQLLGTNLGQITEVTLGNQPAAFTHVSPTRLEAVVPAAAEQYPTVRWRVHWAGGGVLVHDTPFVIVPPTTLNVDSSAPFDYVDPALAYFVQSWHMEDATCARLFSYRDETTPASGPELVPEIAAALPTISPDGRTYTFQVRPGFRFSPPSNATVTAATFEASFERLLNPALQSPAAQFVDDVASIESSGDLLTIVLAEPAGDFLARLAMPFFCPVPLGTPADPVGAAPIPSAGPYYLVSNTSAGALALRNPNYGGDRESTFDRIEWTFGRSLDEIKTRIENGLSDLGTVPFTAAEDLHTRFGPGSPAALAGRQRYFVRPNQVFWYLALNTERVFANEKLRQAVSYALSRNQLSSLYGFDGGTATDQYLPPGMPGYVDHDLYPLAGDLAAAQALATESGATPTTVKLYTFSNSPGPAIAAYVQSALAPLGITVQVETFNRAVQHEKMGTRGEPFDIGVSGWGADFYDPANFLDTLLDGSTIGPTGNLNQSYFDVPAFNARFDAAAALTGAARTAEYADLDHDLATASPLIAYVNTSGRHFFSDRIGCHRFKNGGVALNALCLRP